ncbi:MAG: phage major capsid protein [Candidatus Hodarchaeota archaeon]
MADPGATTAPSSLTVYYDQLLSTTLFNYRAEMVDNIFRSSAWLAALKQYGGIDYQDGGERIQWPLMYEANSTVKSYSGYETLDTTPQDGMTSAFYEWREIAGTISISRKEERQNSGEARLLNLLEKKTMQAEMSMKQAINLQLVQGEVSSATFVPGNSVKDLNPLGYFIRKAPATDPTSGGNVGNISGSTYSWWRPRLVDMTTGTTQTGHAFGITVDSFRDYKIGLYRLYNYCTRGADGSGPNILLGDQVSFETYENALDYDKRYYDEDMASMGFDAIKLKAAKFIWDELVPDVQSGTTSLTYGTVFFINTKFYKLVIDSQTDFVTTPFVEPENQTAKTAKILFMGNAIANNLRKLGGAIYINQSILS